jgi:hypothetical protein
MLHSKVVYLYENMEWIMMNYGLESEIRSLVFDRKRNGWEMMMISCWKSQKNEKMWKVCKITLFCIIYWSTMISIVLRYSMNLISRILDEYWWRYVILWEIVKIAKYLETVRNDMKLETIDSFMID